MEVYFLKIILLVQDFSRFSQFEAARSLKSLHIGKYFLKKECLRVGSL